MNPLHKAAQQAIGLICSARLCEVNSMSSRQEMLRLLIEATDALRTALEQQAEPVTVSVDALAQHIRVVDGNHSLGAGALAEKIVEFLIERGIGKEQAEPVTIERLRDALVASRIIPPAAVEDPEGYDDGVTLYRIEALHRRIT